MAKKRKRRRASMLTKGINIGILALAFWPAIRRLMAGQTGQLIGLYSAGLVREGGSSSFSKALALEAYGPMVAAIVLKKAISMVRRTARV